MNKGNLQANAQLVRVGERKEKKTHRESSSSNNKHPILLFHPETGRSRRPPEVPSALGTFRTAGAWRQPAAKETPSIGDLVSTSLGPRMPCGGRLFTQARV